MVPKGCCIEPNCRGNRAGNGPARVKYGRCRVCTEAKCASHCECARNGVRAGRSAGRPGSSDINGVGIHIPVLASSSNAVSPMPVSAAKASAASAPMQSPRRVDKSDIAALKITEVELTERKRRQFRNCVNIGERPLETGWGYLKRFGGTVCTWAQAINLDLTDWWLRRLQKDEVGSQQLIEFLRWVETQRSLVARQPSSTASSTTSQAASLCCVCQDAEPVVAYIPCGHLCVCVACAETIVVRDDKQACPLCRIRYEQYVRIYA
jgi:hypothetical protein